MDYLKILQYYLLLSECFLLSNISLLHVDENICILLDVLVYNIAVVFFVRVLQYFDEPTERYTKTSHELFIIQLLLKKESYKET